MFIHVGLTDVPFSSVDVKELNDVDVFEEVLEDWMTRLVTQVHDGHATPDQKTDNDPDNK